MATFLEHMITELELRGRSATKERIMLHAERITSLAGRLNTFERFRVNDEVKALERKKALQR